MKQKIAKLIDLKTIITLALIAGLLYGFIVGKISADDFMEIVSIVIVFYFAKPSKKEKEEDSYETYK
jgi:hypothetical protein